jgi:hypothetical protein
MAMAEGDDRPSRSIFSNLAFSDSPFLV